MNGWMHDWMNKNETNEWMDERMTEWIRMKQMNEGMDAWMTENETNEWMDELLGNGVNKWMGMEWQWKVCPQRAQWK